MCSSTFVVLYWPYCRQILNIIMIRKLLPFLDASSHLYMSVYLSLCMSIRMSVRWHFSLQDSSFYLPGLVYSFFKCKVRFGIPKVSWRSLRHLGYHVPKNQREKKSMQKHLFQWFDSIKKSRRGREGGWERERIARKRERKNEQDLAR